MCVCAERERDGGEQTQCRSVVVVVVEGRTVAVGGNVSNVSGGSGRIECGVRRRQGPTGEV